MSLKGILSEREICDIVYLYSIEKQSLRDIASKYNYSKGRIKRVLITKGVKIRTKNEQLGLSGSKISEKLSKLMSEGKIKRAKKITDDEIIDSILFDYVNGYMTIVQVSKKYCYGEWAIWKLLSDKGVTRSRAERFKVTPPYNKGKKGLFHHTKEEKSKISEASKKNWQNSEFKQKVGLLIGKSKLGFKHTEETRKKLREATYRMLSNPKYLEKQRKGRQMKPNSKEKILIDLFEEMGLNYQYTGDYKIFIGTKGHKGRNPDFLNEEKKKVVEHFGEYFHGEKKLKRTKENHEQDVVNHYQKHGYDCLIIWESELKDLANLKKKIIAFDK